MPTETENAVINLLSVTDLPPGTDPGKLIETWGNEAVTVACEIASGAMPGLRKKIRTNAVDALQTIDRPQARETVQLLIKDADTDISIRALRAAASQKNNNAVGAMTKLLQSTALPPLLAAETVDALIKIDSSDARQALQQYESADPTKFPHRDNNLVKQFLKARTR
ncbi:MAG: HEAT repeat domain-containing protein [Nitrobacter sp.]